MTIYIIRSHTQFGGGHGEGPRVNIVSICGTYQKLENAQAKLEQLKANPEYGTEYAVEQLDTLD